MCSPWVKSILTKGHITFPWFSANKDTFLYVFMERGHYLSYPFIHRKLTLGVIVGHATVIQLLEHSQILTFPTSFQTVFNFLSKVFKWNMSFRKAVMWKIPSTVHPQEGHWLIISFMNNNLKSFNHCQDPNLVFHF